MKLVYIASPYTEGDQAANVQRQLEAAHKVMDLGAAPIAPLLNHFMHLIRQRPYEEWMADCLAKVHRCDIVWRMHGNSPGADREVELARSLNIPVVETSWELRETLK